MAYNELTVQIGKALDEYTDEVRETAEKVIGQVAKEALQRVKQNSPVKTGAYRAGWRIRSDGKTTTIYNAAKPGLTQLLEKGHLIRNQSGAWVRKRDGSDETTAFPHIIPAEEWAEQEVARRIEEELP